MTSLVGYLHVNVMKEFSPDDVSCPVTSAPREFLTVTVSGVEALMAAISVYTSLVEDLDRISDMTVLKSESRSRPWLKLQVKVMCDVRPSCISGGVATNVTSFVELMLMGLHCETEARAHDRRMGKVVCMFRHVSGLAEM